MRLPRPRRQPDAPHVKSSTSIPPGDWLARIFAGSHVAIGISRFADGRFVAVNDAFERLFGHKRKAILGRTSLDLGLWPVPEERAQLIEKLRQGEAVQAFEARFRKRSGGTGDLLISASLHDFDGEPHLVGLLTDITDRKRAEREAQVSQAHLNAVLKLSDLLVFHQDRQLRYTWVANPALGVTADDVVGRTDTDMLGSQAARELNAIKRRVLRTGRGERQEARVTRGGYSGFFDLIVEPERAEDGRITGLVGAAANITRRKRAEEQLRLQADILESLEEGVNLVDMQGILRYTNPKFDAMFGYAPGELIGQPVSVLNAPSEATPEATVHAILRALRRDGRWSGELKNRRKDGSEFWTRGNIVATDHPAYGKVWISVQADNTAIHHAQEERDAAYEALGHLTDHAQDAVEDQRRELAREVHDEIGATLTGIRMHLDILAQRECCGEVGDIRVLLDKALQRTRDLCSQLRPPMLDDLGLAETLRWYVRDWSRQTGMRASARIAGLSAEPADPARTDLFRMLQELLTNVARHSGARRVGVSLTVSRGVLQLRVADDGRGFAPDSGAGFGLVGIRERLRRHGGSLRVDSSAGTAVTLRIPVPRP